MGILIDVLVFLSCGSGGMRDVTPMDEGEVDSGLLVVISVLRY